jgi:hypothetical protein
MSWTQPKTAMWNFVKPKLFEIVAYTLLFMLIDKATFGQAFGGACAVFAFIRWFKFMRALPSKEKK